MFIFFKSLLNRISGNTGNNSNNKPSVSNTSNLSPLARKTTSFKSDRGHVSKTNLQNFSANELLEIPTSKGISHNNNDKSEPDSLDTFDTFEDLNKGLALCLETNFNLFCIPSEILGLVSDTMASQYEILPISQDNQTITFLYATQVLKNKAESLLKVQFPSYELIWKPFEQEVLRLWIQTHYFKGVAFEEKASRAIGEKISQVKEEFVSKNEVRLAFDYAGEISGENNKVRDIIANIFCRADQMGATDIIFVNNQELLSNGKIESELLIWVRVDGVLYELQREKMSKKAYDAFILVLKTLSGLNSIQHQSDDTGIIRATLRHGKDLAPVELRVQFMPSGDDRGIGASIRIQKRFNFEFTLESIALFPYQIELLQKLVVEAVHGCTFISGAINRGKNCTLVSLLQAIQKYNKDNKQDKHIVLLEDPAEFILSGISQLTLPKNKTFSQMQKALLRFTPDTIAIGEVRDEDDSAAMVTNLSIIGHPVLTTIHSETACEVPYRLINLGVPRYKIAESLNVVISQILVRKSCTKCEKETDFSTLQIQHLAAYLKHIGMPENTVFLRSTGKTANGTICHNCNGTGFKGRIGVFEILPISEQMREIILRENGSSYQLLRQALSEGFQTIWSNGLRRVVNGETSLQELLRCTPKPTPKSQGLDLNSDLTISQEFAIAFGR